MVKTRHAISQRHFGNSNCSSNCNRYAYHSIFNNSMMYIDHNVVYYEYTNKYIILTNVLRCTNVDINIIFTFIAVTRHRI